MQRNSRVLRSTENHQTTISVWCGAITSRFDPFVDDLATRYRRTHLIIDGALISRRDDVERFAQAVRRVLPGSAILALRGGERLKTVNTLRRLVAWMDDNQVTRRSEAVLAIGGGALLDAASLASSLYRRGITFWRIPTTLLSVIDAGIGAKSAVNFYGRKNLVGSYLLPAGVIVDPRTLTSVSVRQLRSGIAEAVKLGVATQSSLFEMVEDHGVAAIRGKFQLEMGLRLIDLAIETMVRELADDLWESRRLVHATDLGHSFSRTFEEKLHPRPLHGEAVAMDVALSSACAVLMELCSEADHRRITGLLRMLGLPLTHPGISRELLESAYRDVVVHRDSREFPLPIRPGAVTMTSLDPSLLRHALRLL